MAKRGIEEVTPAMGQETGKKRIKVEQKHTSPAPIGSNENPPKASLLGLPAELRNRIYSLTVGAERRISIDHEAHAEHSLLLTCATIRREARQMFFDNNRFDLYFRNGKFEPQSKHWFWNSPIGGTRLLIAEGQPYIENVLDWFRRSREGGVPELAHALGSTEVLMRAEGVAMALKEAPWDIVRGAIEWMLDFDGIQRAPEVDSE